MCRSMDWMGASILMNRWSGNRFARTWCDGEWPGRTRRSILFDFTMSYAVNGKFSVERLLKKSAGSRKPEPNSMNSGSGKATQ